MIRRFVALFVIAAGTGCVEPTAMPETSTVDDAVATCMPGGSFCLAKLPAPQPYTGDVAELSSAFQSYVVYSCNARWFVAIADTQAGAITYHADATGALKEVLGQLFAGKGANASVVKVPTPPRPHCPSAGELLYAAQGTQDLATSVPAANAACLAGM